MAEKTEYLGLTLSTRTEPVDIEVLNENSELIDMAIEDLQNTEKALDAKIKAVQDGVEENSENIVALQSDAQRMSRTLTATTEAEVREALQFAADHPGAYLLLNLTAGLNVTVPTLYYRNCVININGTLSNGEISNTITFEKTGTTSNVHLQNSMLYTQNVRYLGNANGTTRGIGVLRGETGSAIYAYNIVFDQADGSGNFGNNIEVHNGSTVYAEKCTFRAMSTHSVAAPIFCMAGARATVKDCTIAEDSTVKRLGNAENGGFINQIGTEHEVLTTSGGMYALDGIFQSQTTEA